MLQRDALSVNLWRSVSSVIVCQQLFGVVCAYQSGLVGTPRGVFFPRCSKHLRCANSILSSFLHAQRGAKHREQNSTPRTDLLLVGWSRPSPKQYVQRG